MEGLYYDWVTKAKRNTVLHRLEQGKKKTGTIGRPAAFKAVLPFPDRKKGLVSLAIPGLFLAFPREVDTPKGKRKRKVYRPIAHAAVLRLTEESAPEVKELGFSWRKLWYALPSENTIRKGEAVTCGEITGILDFYFSPIMNEVYKKCLNKL